MKFIKNTMTSPIGLVIVFSHNNSMGNEQVGDIAQGMKETGTEFYFAAISLIILMATLSLVYMYFRRLLNKKYIEKESVPQYLIENHFSETERVDLLNSFRIQFPTAFIPPVEKRPSLLEHEAFPMIKERLGAANSIIIVTTNADEALTKVNCIKTVIAKDIARTVLRTYRNVCLSIVRQAYDYQNGYDAFYGDRKRFFKIWNNAYTDIVSIIRKTLIRLDIDNNIVNLYEQARQSNIELVREMIQLAVGSHSDNYWRTHEILNTFYAIARMCNSHVETFAMFIPNESIPLNYIERTTESGSRKQIDPNEITTWGMSDDPPYTYKVTG